MQVCFFFLTAARRRSGTVPKSFKPCGCIRTYVVEVVPGLNEAFPKGEEAAGPFGKQDDGLGQTQHVVDSFNEAQRVSWDVLLQTAQTPLEQDRRDAFRKRRLLI